jgi:cephalosporin hydroxylase
LDRSLVQEGALVIRSFKTFFEGRQIEAYQQGVMNYRYRGILCNKSPLDIAIYLRLLQDARPHTLVEIGSKEGGSALMFRDFGRALGLDMTVVSIDVVAPRTTYEGVRFLEGDVRNLAATFQSNNLFDLPRPWLVVEDSAHTAEGCRAALQFFAQHLAAGEWLVMEDGVLDELGLSAQYGGGPNAAIASFSTAFPDLFAIGTQYCDMFGTQATYNPNGYLMRTAAPVPASAHS